MPTILNTSDLIDGWMTSGKRTYQTAAKEIGAAVGAVHGWRTGTALPSRMAIPALAAALGMEPAALAALVARERSRRVVARAHRRVSCRNRRAGGVRKAGRS